MNDFQKTLKLHKMRPFLHLALMFDPCKYPDNVSLFCKELLYLFISPLELVSSTNAAAAGVAVVASRFSAQNIITRTSTIITIHKIIYIKKENHI